MTEEPTTPDLEEAGRLLREAASRFDLDTVVAMYAPDAVFDPSPLGLEGVFEGRGAIRGVYEAMLAPYDQFQIDIEEFRDLGNGVACTVSLSRGQPKGSNRFLEVRFATVSVWANGLCERITWYADIDEARAAAERLAEERG